MEKTYYTAVIATNTAAIARAEPLSSDECKALNKASDPVLHKLITRLVAIRPAGSGLNSIGEKSIWADGAQRVTLLRTGTTEQVLELDREYEEVRVSVSQLTEQQRFFKERQERALDEEACEGMPAMNEALAAELKRALDAAEPWKRAIEGVAEASQRIVLARGRLRAAHFLRGTVFETEAASEELYEDFRRLAGIAKGSEISPYFSLPDRGQLGLEADRPYLPGSGIIPVEKAA